MCNCGKRRPVPPPPPPPPSEALTASGGPVVQQFVLRTPGERDKVFGSRLEADAVRVREGRGGRVVPT